MRLSEQANERVREKQAKLFYINQKLCLPQNMEQWIPTGKPAHIQMNGQQKRIENKSLGLNWVNGTKDVNEMDGMPRHDRIEYTNYIYEVNVCMHKTPFTTSCEREKNSTIKIV